MHQRRASRHGALSLNVSTQVGAHMSVWLIVIAGGTRMATVAVGFHLA